MRSGQEILENAEVGDWQTSETGHLTGKQRLVVRTETKVDAKTMRELERSVAWFAGPTEVIYQHGKKNWKKLK